MSDLHPLPRTGTGEPRADVIFVHGLSGHPFETWQHDKENPEDSWPYWLAHGIPEVQVHCLEYDAAATNWLGPALPLVERAQNILAVLLGKDIGKRPIVLVCHSLGGLVVKQMLRKTQDENIEAWRRLAGQIKAVVFLGTPHRGAQLADTLFRLGKYLGASPSGRDLQTHNGLLKDLNDWFAGHARGLGIQTHCFYETQAAWIGRLIVEIDSGDFGVPGIPRYPVDADHGTICKPKRPENYRCGYLVPVVREAIGAIVVPRQLPEDPPHFVGREEELQRLLRALEAGAKAAIDGMGGVGKSALAIRAAHQLAARAPDGQIYVELGGASERPLTALEAMTAIHKTFDPGAQAPRDEESAINGYLRVLAGKRVLLVLDNAQDAGTVAPALKHLPEGCLLIITSREAMPFEEIATIGLEELPADQASHLLRKLLGPERASDDELRTLAAWCGHLPLALHAAGAYLTRKRHLRVETYLAALERERGRLAAFKIKGLQSLDVATVLGFSIRHLREDDASLAERWRQLAVFPTSFDLKAAAAVWQTDEVEAEMALQELLARSMVRFEPTSERYRLHDLMRELAYVPLEDEDQAVLKQRVEEAAARHAHHYRSVLAVADELYLDGGESIVAGLALYDLEQRNFVTGQAWAVEHIAISDDHARLAAGYAAAGASVLNLRLSPRVWIGWLEPQLMACRKLGDRRREGSALGNLGLAYAELGEPRRAIEYYEQDLAIAREIVDRRGEGETLGNLGIAYKNMGETRRAIEYHEQHRAIARETGDWRSEAAALANLGNAYADLGEPRRAIEHYQQALAISRENGDRRAEGRDLCNVGLAYADLGEPRRAIEHYEQSLVIGRKMGDRQNENYALAALGDAYLDLSETQRAIEHFDQGLKIAREIGDRRSEGNALGSLGRAHADRGQMQQAIAHYQQHFAISNEIGDRRGQGEALGNLGSAYASLGEPLRAIEYHEQSLVIAREIGYRRGESQALGNLGLAYAALGEPRRAIEHYEQHLAIAREIGDRRGEGIALYNSAVAFDQLGDRAEAIRRMEEALRICDQIEHPSRENARARLAEWRGEGSG